MIQAKGSGHAGKMAANGNLDFCFSLNNHKIWLHPFNYKLNYLTDYLHIPYRTVQYNDLSNRVYTFTTDNTPAEYQKKSTLLLYFAQYMDEHLIHGGDMVHKEVTSVPTGIFMKKWFRTGKAIVMYLNNGTLQVRMSVLV